MRTICVFSLMAILLPAMVSCSDDDEAVPGAVKATARGEYVDSVDGNVYQWVRYGKLDWMAENYRRDLNREAECLFFHDAAGKVVDIRKYGALYTLGGALRACPKGWRLPTDDDWKNLETTLGMTVADSDNRDWRGNIAPLVLNAYGNTCDLALLLGGYFTNHTIMGTTGYRFMSVYGYYWTSTQDEAKGRGYYFYRKLAFNSQGVYRESMETDTQYLSVRYVRDAK